MTTAAPSPSPSPSSADADPPAGDTGPALASRTHDSPIGRFTIVVSDAGVRAVLFPDERDGRVPLDPASLRRGPARPGDAQRRHLDDTARQLDEYFAGRRTTFELALDPVGTPFQLAAWRALGDIPYGETRTYGQQAATIGSPSAVRAVGAANGRNPISVIVPCHRVVGADGSLTGYAGGMHRKRFLLELESGRAALF